MKLYFAYGSNTNLRQMAQRCPQATKIAPAVLLNYSLTFNGKTNGWGVANVHRRNGKQVRGLLWDITSACEKKLDAYEGFPHLYIKRYVTVHTDDGMAYKAMIYVMAAEYNWPAIPDQYYYKCIASGFIQNGIPINSLVKAFRDTVSAVEKGS